MSLEHSPGRNAGGAKSGTGEARPLLLSGYLSRPELAEELNCSERTIARYERLPDGLPHVFIGGRKYYRISEAQAFLARRERRPNPTRRGRP